MGGGVSLDLIRLAACVTPPDGVLAWWSLDEACGPAARDLAGENHANLTGSSVVNGKIGCARRFVPGDVFSADGSGSLNITGQQVSVAAWIKLEESPAVSQNFTAPIGKNVFPDDQPYLLLCETGAIAGNPANTLPLSQWQMEFILINEDGTRLHDQTTGVILTVDDQFHHYAMTYDGTAVYLYVDGQLRYTRAFSGHLRSAPTVPVTIKSTPPFGAPFSVDEILILDRAIPADEIAAIVAAGPIGICKPVWPNPACAIAPAAATNTVGQLHSVTATVTTNGVPVAAVPVCFQVTGANNASVESLTDINGQAGFQYTGAHAGSDTIQAVASLGEQSATATATKLWVTEPPTGDHDLAIIKMKAPKSINLNAASPALTQSVVVQIQNRSLHNEVITNLTGLVTLVAESLGTNCPNATVTLHAGPPNILPRTWKPKGKMNVFFDVTFDCANAPAKGAPDFRHLAAVHREVLDGQPDTHPACDTCPRPPLPGGVDPNPDGRVKDKGCGNKDQSTGQLGAEVLTDVVVQ